MTIPEQATAIINNVLSGLDDVNNNCPISQEQVEEEVILERAQVIKEYLAKQLILPEVLAQTIHGIDIDQKPLQKFTKGVLKGESHFEIPKLILDLQQDTVLFMGTPDRRDPYFVYLDMSWSYHEFRIRGSRMPYVYVDTTPNENDALDCYLFNAPAVEDITVTAIFQDPREPFYQNLRAAECDTVVTSFEEFNDHTFIANDVIRRLSEKYLRHFVQVQKPVKPNDQTA